MDYNLRDIFVDGAQWWSEQKDSPMTDDLHLQAMVEASDRFTRISRKPSPTMLLGRWDANDPRRAFVDGAHWYEWASTGFTMWNSDVRIAETEAEKRFDSWILHPFRAQKAPAGQTPPGD